MSEKHFKQVLLYFQKRVKREFEIKCFFRVTKETTDFLALDNQRELKAAEETRVHRENRVPRGSQCVLFISMLHNH